MDKKATLFRVLLFASVLASAVCAEEHAVCIVYFTGVGCPHCSKTDPVILGELPVSYNGSLIVIEYEMYQHPENAQLMTEYREKYGIKYGVPQMVVARDFSIVGDKPILDSIKDVVENPGNLGNPCPIIGNEKPFRELDLNKIPGSPQIWVRNRVLARTGAQQADDTLLKKLISCDTISAVEGVRPVKPFTIPLSGGKIEFNKAVSAGGWTLLWNEDGCEDTEPHKVTGRWIWYYLEKSYYVVLALGVLFLAYMILYEKKRTKVSEND